MSLQPLRIGSIALILATLVPGAAGAHVTGPSGDISERLDRICTYLETKSANQRAAAERQLSEEIGAEDLQTLRAYLERPLSRPSLRGLARRFDELVVERLARVEADIMAFEAARRLAVDQREEDLEESTEDTRERLRATRQTRNQAYRDAHAGFATLKELGIALAPPLWRRSEMGSSSSLGVRRFRSSLQMATVEEARRSFPSAPESGSIAPFVERAIIPLTAALRPDDPDGWRRFQERAADRAFQLLSTLDPLERQEGRSILLELGEWGQARMERWVDEGSVLPRSLRHRLLEWNRFRVPVGFVETTGLDLAGYRDRPVQQRQEILYRLEWVGGSNAVPILRRILELEEDISLQVASAAALARLLAPEGAEFLRQLGLREATELEGISRDVLLIEAIHRRDAGDFAGALEDLQNLLRRYPPNFRVHYELALTALQGRQLELSIRHFLQALKIDGSNHLAHYNLACAYALNGQPEEALASLRASVETGFRDADHTLADEDLASLRELPEFQRIVESMRKK